MALVVFVHDGGAVDYAPTADVAAGAVVVQGDLVGVSRMPLAANVLGSLAVAGVFDFPKAAGTGTAITAGTKVYWDATDKQAKADDETGVNKLLGKTTKAAADADTTVRVRMSQ